jgi:hypothetical protein
VWALFFIALALSPHVNAELRAVVVFGGDKDELRLGWLTALCNVYKSLTGLVSESRIALFVRYTRGELNKLCNNKMEDNVLYTDPDFTKVSMLENIRYYAYNHNVILIVLGHGHLPRDKTYNKYRWTTRITDQEIKGWNITLADAHPDHIDMVKTLTAKEMEKRGLMFFEYMRAKYESNLQSIVVPEHNHPIDPATPQAVLSPVVNTIADLPPLTASVISTFKLKLAVNAKEIGGVTMTPHDYDTLEVQDDVLLKGSDIMALGQPWYNLVVLPLYSYAGGFLELSKNELLKRKIWFFSPSLAYHELEPAHASALGVALLQNMTAATKTWMTEYDFQKSFLDGCKAFYTSQRVERFQGRRCIVYPEQSSTLVLRQKDGTYYTTWAWANWTPLSTTYFYTTVANYAAQPVSIWIKLKTSNTWKRMDVPAGITLDNFIKLASTTLVMRTFDRHVWYHVLDPSKFKLVCFVKGPRGNFVEMNWLLLRSLRDRSNVQCNTPFTPDTKADATEDFTKVSASL